MAYILRGKNKGQEVKIHQFSNDWVMLEDGKIMNPRSLEYTYNELLQMGKDKSPGFFWDVYAPIRSRVVGNEELSKLVLR